MELSEKFWKFIINWGFIIMMVIFFVVYRFRFTEFIHYTWVKVLLLSIVGLLGFFVVMYKMREHTDNKITLKSILYTLAWIALFGYLFGGFRN